MRQATHFRGTAMSKSRASRGQSVVELALMLPVLMLLLAAILDLGRIYYAYITVVNVAREGARFGAAHPPNQSCLPGYDDAGLAKIVERARKEAEASKITAAQLTVLVECESTGHESPIKVTVWYDFRPILTNIVLVGGPIRLRAQAQMQIFAQ